MPNADTSLLFAVPISHESSVIVTRPCIRCGIRSAVIADRAKTARFLRDTHVQDVWPEWTPDKRELLISGTHPKCWTEMFGDEEE